MQMPTQKVQDRIAVVNRAKNIQCMRGTAFVIGRLASSSGGLSPRHRVTQCDGVACHSVVSPPQQGTEDFTSHPRPGIHWSEIGLRSRPRTW